MPLNMFFLLVDIIVHIWEHSVTYHHSRHLKHCYSFLWETPQALSVIYFEAHNYPLSARLTLLYTERLKLKTIPEED